MKNVKTMFIMIVSICIVAALGVVLILHTQGAKDKMKDTISLASVTESGEQVSEVLSFESLSLMPSGEDSYVIRFTNIMSGTYVLTLEFTETADGGLKQFVDVAIVLDGKNPQDLSGGKSSLSGYLASGNAKKTISKEVEFEENEQVSLKITYSMDSSVGDTEETKSAQGAWAKFNLKLTVKKA